MLFISLYILSGIIITELTANDDEEYKEYINTDLCIYIIEVITWLPDLFNFFDDDDENLGY